METTKDNQAKFLRLYTGVQAKLYSFILAIVHNRVDADELFQETTVVLWEQFDRYEEGANFGAWAIGIAKNKVFDYLRKNKKTKTFMSDDFCNRIISLANNSSDDIEDRVKALDSCVKKLSSVEQKLLTFRFRKDYSVKKISQLTGNSSSTIYKNISRTILRLRFCIKRTLTQWEAG